MTNRRLTSLAGRMLWTLVVWSFLMCVAAEQHLNYIRYDPLLSPDEDISFDELFNEVPDFPSKNIRYKAQASLGGRVEGSGFGSANLNVALDDAQIDGSGGGPLIGAVRGTSGSVVTRGNLSFPSANYRMSIHFPKENYSSSLGDVSTVEHQRLKGEITDHIHRIFGDVEGNQTATVESFAAGLAGGLTANIHLRSLGFADHEHIRNHMRNALATKSLGRFHVSTDGFDISQTSDDAVASALRGNYRMSINLPQEKYFPSLGDSSTLEFKLLSTEIVDHIHRIFGDVEGNQTATVESFTAGPSGGISAKIHLRSVGFADQELLRSRMRAALTSGRLGRFQVTLEGFNISETMENASAVPASSTNYHMSINFPREKYFPSLGNSSSLEFQLISVEMAQRIQNIFDDLEGNQTATIESITAGEAGAIVAKVHLRSIGFADQEEIRSRMRVALASGHLGRFHVTTDGFDISQTTESAKASLPGARSGCRAEKFFCRDGGCLDHDLHCDGNKDCADGSDESDCELKLVSMIAHPLVLNVTSGQNIAQFFCGSGDLRHKVSWSRKAGILPTNAKISPGSLTIRNATVDDAGEYICSAQRALPGSSVSVQLNVYPEGASAAAGTDQPDAEIDVAFVYGFEHENATLECESDDPSAVRWARTDNESISESSSLVNGVLTIVDLQLDDAGFYECSVVGEELVSQSMVQLFVNPGKSVSGHLKTKKKTYPSISPDNATVTEGDAVEFHCAPGKASLEIEWLRDDLPISAPAKIEAGNLIIPVSKLNDTGKYVCRHKGKKGEQHMVFLTVNPAPTTITTTQATTTTTTATTTTIAATIASTTSPKTSTMTIKTTSQISTGRQSIEEAFSVVVQIGEQRRVLYVDAGANIRIQCLPVSQSDQVEWTADGDQIPNFDSNGHLTIVNASLSNIGTFHCRERLRPDQSVELEVRIHKPKSAGEWTKQPNVFVSPRIFIGLTGEDFFFECNVASDHDEIKWERIGGELPSNSRIDGTRLIFSSIKEIDRGLYSCYIVGGPGGVESTGKQPSGAGGDALLASGGTLDYQDAGQLIVISRRQQPGHKDEDDEEFGTGERVISITIGDPFKSVARPRGSRAILTCQSSDEVEWVREDGSDLPPNAQMEGNTLTISSLGSRDSARYLCRVSGDASRNTLVELITVPGEVSGYLKFIGIQVQPRRFVVDEGEEITLDCQTSSSEAFVEWSRAGFELTRETEVQNNRLAIPSAQLTDTGFYVCRAIGARPGSQNFAQVSVRNKRSTNEQPPTNLDGSLVTIYNILVPSTVPDSYHHEEKRMIKLVCKSADGAQTVWEREDRRPMSGTLTDGVLFIESPTVKDSGTYLCRVQDDPEKITRFVFTVVKDERLQEQPDGQASTDNRYVTSDYVVVTPSQNEVDEGATAIFQCQLPTEDRSRIRWEKVDGDLPAGVNPYNGQLVLNKVRSEDAGRYQCTAVDLDPPNQGYGELIVSSRGDEGSPEEGLPTENPAYPTPFVSEPVDGVQMYIYPGADVRVEEGDPLVLDCQSSDPSILVVWSGPHSRRRRQAEEAVPGRLIIESARKTDSGTYTCRFRPKPGKPYIESSIQVKVGDSGSESRPQVLATTGRPAAPTTAYPFFTSRPVIPSRCQRDEATCMNGQCIPRAGLCNGIQDCSDNSDEKNCADQCEPTEMRCNNGKCVQKIWICDGEDDCGDQSDEQDCTTAAPGSHCGANQFLCESGDQCYPKNFQCDGTNDCVDGTDEIGCSPPTISRSPIDSQQVKIGDTVTISCEAVGFPVPLISWRLNWGNVPVPPRVTATSENGLGTLTIRNFQESDQGAYSCEAINNQNAVIATPDCIVTLEGTVSDICKPPLFNAGARTPSDCLPCFCNLITQNCRSCGLYLSQIPSPASLSLIDQNGNPITNTQIQHTEEIYDEYTIKTGSELLQMGSVSWELPAEFLGDRVASYGTTLNYSIKHGPGGQPTFFPDVIIEGNDLVLYYKSPDPADANTYVDYSVPLKENSWSKRPDGQFLPTEVVTREDMLTVLQDVEYIRIRAVYDSLSDYSSIRGITMGTAVAEDKGKGLAHLIERCICPVGYDGLSCERCSNGYSRDETKQCRPTQQYRPSLPEEQCDPRGSVYFQREPSTRTCLCKEHATGDRCDQCKPGFFNLNANSLDGCDSCFCSGLTQDCRSSGYGRQPITVRPSEALDRGLRLTDLDRKAQYTGQLEYSSSEDLVVLYRRPINGPLYWQLPIAGNRVTAYGGNLTVNLRVDQLGGEIPVHVQLSGNAITLNHNSTQQILRNQVTPLRIPINAQEWTRENDNPTSREHLIMALANLDYIIVRASSNRADRQIAIGEISLDIASASAYGGNADDVELCSCPTGYSGTSCEKCDRGYFRSRGGLYLGFCHRCECNGHADECDPESGVCQNCRDNTAGERCATCAAGFEGDARSGRPDGCRRLSRPPSPHLPRFDVRVEPREVEVQVGGYARLYCVVDSREPVLIVWHKNTRQPLPANSLLRDDNSLSFPRSQPENSGVYTCTASVINRPGISQSASGRLFVRAPIATALPPFYRPEPSLMVYVVPPKSKTVYVGDTVQFQCVVQSSVVYTAVWTKLGGKLPTRDSDVAGVLTITNVQPKDAGTYQCTGSNPYLTATDQAQLIVQGHETDTATVPPESTEAAEAEIPEGASAPQARIEPYFLRINEGEEAAFRCIATGYPQPRTTWHGGPDGVLNPSATVSNGVLRIPSVRSEDETEYFCNATNIAGTHSVRTVLFVTRAEGLPDVRVEESEIRTRPGESVELRCNAYGEPEPEISWSRVDGPLPTSAIQQAGILTIDGLTEPDQGVYVCTARNTKGSRQAEVRVIIREGAESVPVFPPAPTVPALPIFIPDEATTETPVLMGRQPSVSIEPATIMTSEGETIEVVCRVQGSPEPVIRWNRYGGTPDSRHKWDNDRYIITNARLDDRGTYFCIAENALGRTEASVTIEIEERQEPRIEIYPKASQIVQPGQPIFFQCQVLAGTPPPTITWSRADGQPLTPKVIVQDRADVISFMDIGQAESGSYICTAENKFGKVTATAELVVQGLPRVIITPSGSVRKTRGDHIQIECSAENDDTGRISWFRDSINGIQLTGPDRGVSVLDIPNAKRDDSGLYVCQVENESGSTSFSVQIQIEDEDNVLPSAEPVASEPSTLPTSTGQPGSRIRIEPSQIFVGQGDAKTGRFVCIHPEAGQEQIQYRWRRIDNKPISMRAVQNGNYLDFDGLTAEDSGVYVCSTQTATSLDTAVAALNVEEDQRQELLPLPQPTVLNVSEAPPADDNLERTKNTIIRGQRAVLQCEGLKFDSDTSVRWTRREGALPATHRIEGSSLVIESISEDDAGSYICSVGDRVSTTVIFVSAVVPRFRGRRDSFAILPMESLPKTAKFEIDLELTVKPDEDKRDGIILFNGVAADATASSVNGKDFIVLGLKDGYAEFRFDAGDGTAVITSPRPLSPNQWHSIRVRRNRREATLIVDNENPVTGRSPGKLIGLDLTSNLYIGGIPDSSQYSQNLGFTENFAGCVGAVRIGSVVVDVFRNASEQNNVVDCNSCSAASVCENNGLCQDALTPIGYKCHCPRGFTGLHCEQAGLRCHNGICGGGRCIDTESSYQCLCPWGKTGEKCTTDLTVKIPSFSKRAYAAYATPANVLNQLNLEIVFKARSLDDGIIMYAGAGNNGLEDFFSLTVKDGSLELRFDAGSGHAVLRSLSQLRLNSWYRITVDRADKVAQMKINDEEDISGETPGNLTGLNLRTNLYIGGVGANVAVAAGVEVKNGFDGCVSAMIINGAVYELANENKIVDSANVQDCGEPSVCVTHPCRNNGVCLVDGPSEYHCECKKGYSGRNCELQKNICSEHQQCLNQGTCTGNGTIFECNCKVGYIGVNCETAIPIDKTVAFTGNGYMEFPGALLPHSGAKEADIVSLSLKTSSQNALILWQGPANTSQVGNNKDYLSLHLKDGQLLFSYELGSGPAKILSDVKVNDNQWHKVTIKRMKKQGTLSIDENQYTYFGESKGRLISQNAHGNIFVGGISDVSRLTIGQHSGGFTGCIRDVEIHDSGVLNLRERSVSGRNAIACVEHAK